MLERKTRWQRNGQCMDVCGAGGGGGGGGGCGGQGVKLGWGSSQMERWGRGRRREGGGGEGCAEWYLQCAGCEACHLSSNRKPVCGRKWNAKADFPFPFSRSLYAAICAHRVTAPISNSSSAVPVPSVCLRVSLSPVTYAGVMQFPTILWSES